MRPEYCYRNCNVDSILQDLLFCQTSELARRVSRRSEPTLSDDHASAVFRIVQEALTNVGRHAQASHVDVVLYGGDDGFDVTVNDDGIGFDVTGATEGG